MSDPAFVAALASLFTAMGILVNSLVSLVTMFRQKKHIDVSLTNTQAIKDVHECLDARLPEPWDGVDRRTGPEDRRGV